MATGPIETHLHRSFNWENGAPGPQEGPRGRSANCGNGLFAQCVRLRSEINLVLSRGNQDYFKEAYGREAALIPNGITPEPDLPAKEIAERWGLTASSYVLYLGRIVPEKRPELLVEAFRGLDADKRLVIAGDSSDTGDYMAALRKAGTEDPRVLFTGHVEGDVLTELYSNAYCYVLPSDVEGMPMSLLEAMSHGCACVTSDIPECADVLAGCGVTFPRDDAAALRDVLASLLADPARVSALGDSARERANTEYDWDRVVARTLELYEQTKEVR